MAVKPTLLARPGKIGTMELRNRLVIPAISTNYTYQGHFTDRAVHFYGLRAKGGAGLIILEACAVDYPSGRSVLNSACSEDKFIASLNRLTDEVHRHGAKIVLQIMHAGRQTNSAISGSQPVSCSSVASTKSLYRDKPRPLTLEECQEMIERFGQGALRAKKAGFDGVEVHCAHGYLLSSFLSPALNIRTDIYGAMEGGLKLCCDTITKIKDSCGEDYPVIARINGDDYHPAGGVTHIDARLVAVALEKAGVDAIDVSAGLRESDHILHDQTSASPRGSWVYMAEGIKKSVTIPVMIAKRIAEDMVENILADGQADFVCVGRPTIADPEYGNKLLAGKVEEIVPCIWCVQGCYDVLWMLTPITCLTNPSAGSEDERPFEDLPQAPVLKKVMVVGGGPAGCEAALVAAKRGHDVTLYEKHSRLGGAFRLACQSPAKQEFERFLRYFEANLPTAEVRVFLDTEMTADRVIEEQPEVVILAVGARESKAGIETIHEEDVVSVEDAMEGRAAVGRRVVILACSNYCRFTCRPKTTPVDGDVTGVQSKYSYACRSGYAAVDAADYFAARGKLVSIVTEREQIVPGMGYTSRSSLMRRFYRNNIRVCTNAKVLGIDKEGVTLQKAGVSFLLDADTIITSVASKPRRRLAKELTGKVGELFAIGDCNKIGNAMKAVEDARRVAMEI